VYSVNGVTTEQIQEAKMEWFPAYLDLEGVDQLVVPCIKKAIAD
jgi:hypothetical protein